MIIEEIQTCNCPIRPRIIWLLFNPDRSPRIVEGHYTVALRITHLVGEKRRALLPVSCELEQLPEAVSEKNVVAQNERDAVRAYEIGPDRKRLRKSLRPCLLGIAQPNGPLTSITEQPCELRAILRGRDNQNIADAR